MLYTLIYLGDYYTIKCNRIRLKYNIMSVSRSVITDIKYPSVSHIINSQKINDNKVNHFICIIINNIIT